ncbi:MAG: hypothetical protein BJ554DRAFT_366 [Olpidium bornovanus]|uniref:Uncharacterized protein n=1 Tax=Olpidium bornovanus TaxID=278681 RepID=A0A8H8DHV9_9FUNG|nr:MAG: hypothetical protein BJ554DRAFT_366 [Olpidium bornovanus]
MVISRPNTLPGGSQAGARTVFELLVHGSKKGWELTLHPGSAACQRHDGSKCGGHPDIGRLLGDRVEGADGHADSVGVAPTERRWDGRNELRWTRLSWAKRGVLRLHSAGYAPFHRRHADARCALR